MGTFIGHNGTAYFTPSMLDLCDKFMQLSGVTPQKIGELLVQKRITGNKEAWIITNPTEKDLTETFSCADMKNPALVTGDNIQFMDGKGRISLKSLDVAILVFEKI